MIPQSQSCVTLSLAVDRSGLRKEDRTPRVINLKTAKTLSLEVPARSPTR